MNKQKRALIVLFGILVLALIYAFWATPRQRKVSEAGRERVTQRAATPSVPTQVPAPGEGDQLRVRLELLEREPEAYQGFKRDIFHFPRVRRPSPVPPSPPPPPVEPSPVAPPPAPKPEPAYTSEEVRRELARFRFLGYLLKGSTRTIFLESGEEIFVVRRGDRFGEEDEFLVTGLTPETLTIRQSGDERPILVPLVEQAPLVPDPTGHRRPPTPESTGSDPFGSRPVNPAEGSPPEDGAPPAPEPWHDFEPEGMIPGGPSMEGR